METSRQLIRNQDIESSKNLENQNKLREIKDKLTMVEADTTLADRELKSFKDSNQRLQSQCSGQEEELVALNKYG